jgi:hypothetical protein
MVESANGYCFSEPHWRVIAKGFQTETWFNDGQLVRRNRLCRVPPKENGLSGIVAEPLSRSALRELPVWPNSRIDELLPFGTTD